MVSAELEALRIEVMQGEAEQALPGIEARLDEARGWRLRHRAGEAVSETSA